ncbi:MAG: hypothetical protein JSW34_05520 [Candidatus Zixiibacteriota bacterium]|nr:MAG: hypothetical protein JSW34_05520 [candidate division Zixibacteria bacterium]
MRNAVTYMIYLTLAVALGTSAFAGDTSRPCCVTRVSGRAIYLDGGTRDGFHLGDTVALVRRQETIAVALITRVAETAAAAELSKQIRPVQVGDVAARLDALPQAASGPAAQDRPAASVEKKDRPKSRLKGTVSLQGFWRHDMTDSELDRYQPALRTRLEVTNVAGSDLSLKMRHRSRLYHRARAIRIGQDTNDWVHRLYELGLFHEVEDSKADWAVGRVLSPYVRGVGYVDGGYLAYRIHPNFRIGLAGGVVPNRVNSEPDFDRRKLGVFASFESGTYATGRLAFTAALSTEYDNSTVSRDFIYVQGTYSRNQLLSLYQSVEIDLNRDWRYDRTDERFSFTNYYANASVNITGNASVFFSYDARKNIRYIEVMDTPDSLFNDDVHKGVRAGFNLRLFSRLHFRSTAGMRFREDQFDDNKFASASLRLIRFPLVRHSIMLSMHVVETHFTTGYRPMLSYRFPLSRRVMLNLTGSGYIYKAGSIKTSYYYGEARTSYNFARRYFISGSYRQYFDDELKSIEVSTELGVRL